MCDFRYEDAWEPFADGGGYTLVVADEGIPADQLGQVRADGDADAGGLSVVHQKFGKP